MIKITESTVVQVKDSKHDHLFKFDHVFSMDSTQESVFLHTGAPLVEKVLQGINCTLFAYGQTGSGKTFSMEGVIGSKTKEGLIPRMVRTLFGAMLSMDESITYTLEVSYVEIYNERLKDLLNPNNRPVVRGDGSGGVVIKNVQQIFVSSPNDVFVLLHNGHANRSVSKTLMNAAV